jgi:pimeloyl-ACP methyl ester carboxylesterase
MSSKPMERARVDGAELEFEVTGTGDPVLLIHGAFLAEAYAPLCAEPALTGHCLVRYHRRGYAGSSPVTAPFTLGQQAADCRALLEHLGIERAHVVGHSSGGAIALQLALDAPQVVHSLILLEPALLDVPSGALLPPSARPGVGAVRRRQQGERDRQLHSLGDRPRLPRLAGSADSRSVRAGHR